MRAPFLLLAAFLFTAVLVGCNAPRRLSSTEPPALVVYQLPDYPMPGRDSDFPGGLLAAFWRDGRMIRSTGPKAVGKTYVEGVIMPPETEEFFRFLSTIAIVRAPQNVAIPVEAATQDITIRSEESTSHWTRVLPDTTSVWREVELRLFSLPLQHSHAVIESNAEDFIRKN